MGRPSGTKNTMRTPEEKEKIVLEYLNGRVGYRVVAQKIQYFTRTLQQMVERIS